MGSSTHAGVLIMESAYDIELANVEKECDQLSVIAKNEMNALESIDFESLAKHSSTMDAWDYCFSLAMTNMAE